MVSSWQNFPAALFVYSLSPFLCQKDFASCIRVSKDWNKQTLTALTKLKQLQMTYEKFILVLEAVKNFGSNLEHLTLVLKANDLLLSQELDFGRFTSLKKLTTLLPRKYQGVTDLFSPTSATAFHLLQCNRKPLAQLDLYLLSSQDYFFFLEQRSLLKKFRVKELNVFFFVDRIRSWQYQHDALHKTLLTMLQGKYCSDLEQTNWIVCVFDPNLSAGDGWSQRRACRTLQNYLQDVQDVDASEQKASDTFETCVSKRERAISKEKKLGVKCNLFASPRVFENLPKAKGTVLSNLLAQRFNQFRRWDQPMLQAKPWLESWQSSPPNSSTQSSKQDFPALKQVPPNLSPFAQDPPRKRRKKNE